MLKAEFHIHANGDVIDNIVYSPKELIDDAAQKGFDVLAITSHDIVLHTKELEEYAGRRGILLIPGVERTIEGKHVLIYNLTEEESQQITSFEDLKRLKQYKQEQNIPFLVVAPHPFFYGPMCLRNKIIEHLDLFDAWEHSFFYTKLISRNRRLIKLNKRYQKPLVGNSDVHHLKILGTNYTYINSEKNISSVFQAIKENKLELKTRPLAFFKFSYIFVLACFSGIKKLLREKG